VKGHATVMFSLEELRLIAHCITFALVRDGLKPNEWRDAKQVLDDITAAIHEGNLRREDEGSAPWSERPEQAAAADSDTGRGGGVEPDQRDR
jgi:hypothetical protein